MHARRSMRRIGWGMLIAFCALLCMMVMAPGAAAAPAPLVERQALSASLINARDMFPSTPGHPSPYDNPTTRAVRFANGTVTAIPHTNGIATLSIRTFNLQNNVRYRVYIDTNGISQGRLATVGPFIDTHVQFTTHRASGTIVGNVTLNVAAQRGPHVWSVYLNDTRVGLTVLISRNLFFSEPSPMPRYYYQGKPNGAESRFASGVVNTKPVSEGNQFTKTVNLEISVQRLFAHTNYALYAKEGNGNYVRVPNARTTFRTNAFGNLFIDVNYTYRNVRAPLLIALNNPNNFTVVQSAPIYLNGVEGAFVR